MLTFSWNQSDILNLKQISVVENGNWGRGKGCLFDLVLLFFSSNLLTPVDGDCWLSLSQFDIVRDCFLFPFGLYEIYLFIHSSDVYLACHCTRHCPPGGDTWEANNGLGTVSGKKREPQMCLGHAVSSQVPWPCRKVTFSSDAKTSLPVHENVTAKLPV